jgi:hypothetical protein
MNILTVHFLKFHFSSLLFLSLTDMLFSGTLSFILVHTNLAKNILPPDFLTLPVGLCLLFFCAGEEGTIMRSKHRNLPSYYVEKAEK